MHAAGNGDIVHLAGRAESQGQDSRETGTACCNSKCIGRPFMTRKHTDPSRNTRPLQQPSFLCALALITALENLATSKQGTKETIRTVNRNGLAASFRKRKAPVAVWGSNPRLSAKFGVGQAEGLPQRFAKPIVPQGIGFNSRTTRHFLKPRSFSGRTTLW